MVGARFCTAMLPLIRPRRGLCSSCGKPSPKRIHTGTPSSTTTRSQRRCSPVARSDWSKTKRTSVQAPWQNGIAERWIGSCRREMLDYLIPLNERHLRRLLREYVSYHNDDRVHDALHKDAPNRRPVDERPSPAASVIPQPRIGGLHHRYNWTVAA
jgi:Integrase core domain